MVDDKPDEHFQIGSYRRIKIFIDNAGNFCNKIGKLKISDRENRGN